MGEKKPAQTSAKPIIMVSGNKGGVGKSIVSAAVVEFLTEAGKQVFLVDADTSNPDVGKAYMNQVKTDGFNLSIKDGWQEMGNAIHDHPDHFIVINMRAASDDSMADFGAEMLKLFLPALGRPLVTLWVINTDRECVAALRDYLDIMPTEGLHVVRNLQFGKQDDFSDYNNSKSRKMVEEAGGKTIDFDALGTRCSRWLRSEEATIARGIKEMAFGDRIELQRWQHAVNSELAKIRVAV